jgi:hypothetical protein
MSEKRHKHLLSRCDAKFELKVTWADAKLLDLPGERAELIQNGDIDHCGTFPDCSPDCGIDALKLHLHAEYGVSVHLVFGGYF